MAKRLSCASLLVIVPLAAAGCGGDTLTSPTATLDAPAAVPQSLETGPASLSPEVPLHRPYTVEFTDVGPPDAPVTTYMEDGFTISAGLASWTASGYGHPPPFIQFSTAAGTTTVGEVTVTATESALFWFTSVEFYASTTEIPYVITGTLRGRDMFTLSGTLGHTFGGFARVDNPNKNHPIDTLVIRLSNEAFPCCNNPMGLDNIVLRR
jgi:hypothetical protein